MMRIPSAVRQSAPPQLSEAIDRADAANLAVKNTTKLEGIARAELDAAPSYDLQLARAAAKDGKAQPPATSAKRRADLDRAKVATALARETLLNAEAEVIATAKAVRSQWVIDLGTALDEAQNAAEIALQEAHSCVTAATELAALFGSVSLADRTGDFVPNPGPIILPGLADTADSLADLTREAIVKRIGTIGEPATGAGVNLVGAR